MVLLESKTPEQEKNACPDAPTPSSWNAFCPTELRTRTPKPAHAPGKVRKNGMKTMFSQNIGLLEKVMDLHLDRQNVVMTNLANQDVASFKARQFDFEKELQSALNIDARGKVTRTDAGHMPSVFSANGFQGDLTMGWKPRVTQGLDSVNMEKEMSIMAKNTLMYNALTDITKKDFEGLQKVITDGGK
jgi:flagellar basal-body rod protein FlgB